MLAQAQVGHLVVTGTWVGIQKNKAWWWHGEKVVVVVDATVTHWVAWGR